MTSIILNRRQSREVDRIAIDEYGFDGLVLMENAGSGCARILLEADLAADQGVVILCGPGNNGGDGFVIARHLTIGGISTRLVVFADPRQLSGDALANYRLAEKMEIPMKICQGPIDSGGLASQLELDGTTQTAWIVDALLGTGAVPPPRPPLDQVIRQVNEHPARKLAVDIPTGLDCDTGNCPGESIRADLTATFASLKPCFSTPAGRQTSGRVRVVSIGVPATILNQAKVNG